MTDLVPAPEEFPGKDAAVLRSLMGLMALPALWAGKGERTILQLMTDALFSVVPLSAIYVQVQLPPMEERIVLLRLGNKPLAERVPAQWQDFLFACDQQSARTAPLDSPAGLLSVVRFHMGASNKGESIWFASPDPGFPSLHQMALLHAAVTLTTTGLNTARVDSERTMANRRKDEFLAMLGHELRNPLAPLVTTLELIRLKGRDPQAKEHALMARQVGHLSRLVDALLDVTRITGDKVELKSEVFDLHDVVNHAVDSVSGAIEEKGHHLTVEGGELNGLIKGDPERIRQVFANLMSNAAKYTQPGGQIVVTAVRRARTLSVSILDNGEGIGPDLLPKVFDLFEQGPTTIDRARGGLGVGLAVARKIVDLHHGRITAASSGHGEGSRFTVHLPLFEPAATEPENPMGRAQDAGAADAAIRVMVVDDNLDALETLEALLTLYGFDVMTASTPEQALQQSTAFAADAYVLDIGLPGMDGYELAAALRQRAPDEIAAAQFIALTGYGQEGDKARALNAGFHIHLTKPVNIENLLTALRDGPSGAGAHKASLVVS